MAYLDQLTVTQNYTEILYGKILFKFPFSPHMYQLCGIQVLLSIRGFNIIAFNIIIIISKRIYDIYRNIHRTGIIIIILHRLLFH